MKNNYDFIIIGCGLSGVVVASELANSGYRILIIDKRKHIGGNCFDEEIDNITVHKYGPHVLHTNSNFVYKYLINKYKWLNFRIKSMSYISDIYYYVPFSFLTIDKKYEKEKAIKIKKNIMSEFNDNKIIITELMASSDKDIKEFATFLYEENYLPYAQKQWDNRPENLDPSIIFRVPFFKGNELFYFKDKYQIIPEKGWTYFIQSMLNNENIDILLKTDMWDIINMVDNKLYFNNKEISVIYTGSLDTMFNYRYGELPYRTTKFEIKKFPIKSYQPEAFVAYPKEEYTRATEYSKIPHYKYDNLNNTIVIFEYSRNFIGDGERLYPIINEKNKNLHSIYSDEAKLLKNFYFLGRLAMYKYMNMDEIILKALELSKYIIEMRK